MRKRNYIYWIILYLIINFMHIIFNWSALYQEMNHYTPYNKYLPSAYFKSILSE